MLRVKAHGTLSLLARCDNAALALVRGCFRRFGTAGAEAIARSVLALR
jgi:hypothetical protein